MKLSNDQNAFPNIRTSTLTTLYFMYYILYYFLPQCNGLKLQTLLSLSFILVHIILLLSFREAFPDQSFCVIVGLFYVFYSSTPRAQMRSSFHLLPSESKSITDRQHVRKIQHIFYAHVLFGFLHLPLPYTKLTKILMNFAALGQRVFVTTFSFSQTGLLLHCMFQ